MNRAVLFLLAGMVLLSSCKHLRKTTGSTPILPKESSMDKLKAAILSNAPDYQWIRINGAVNYKDSDKEYAANTSIKLQKDNLIWSSLTFLIEIARAEVNRDSAVLMMRTNKEYRVYPVSGLKDLLGIDGLTLTSLQNLLTAQPPFAIKADTVRIEDGNYLIEYKSPYYLERMKLDLTDLKLREYHYEKNAGQQVTITYSDFTLEGNLRLPRKIQAEVHTPKKILITLDVTDYSLLDTDEAPFTIPSSYKRVH